VRNRAPKTSNNAGNGVKDAISSAFLPVPLTQAAFNQRHPLEFFGYKDLQCNDLFGPTMAFRVTRTPEWLSPAIHDGRPKYLPEDVLAALNRPVRAKSQMNSKNALAEVGGHRQYISLPKHSADPPNNANRKNHPFLCHPSCFQHSPSKRSVIAASSAGGLLCGRSGRACSNVRREVVNSDILKSSGGMHCRLEGK
jgi:hypothetical protein